MMHCCLCGTIIPHQRVEPFDVARRIYRATVIGPHVYVPAKHSQTGLCPDPDGTASWLWAEATFDECAGVREGYKRARRSRVERETAQVEWEP